MASAQEKGVEDLEAQPLLQKPNEKSKLYNESDKGGGSEISYDAARLLSWALLYDIKGTIWMNESLWRMIYLLSTFSLSVACAVCFFVHDAEQVEGGRFRRISNFLTVIIGLLLSFFLGQAIDRWYKCVNGFMDLFDSIRFLHIQLVALNVPRDRLQLMLRYAMLSAHCLNHDLVKSQLPKEAQQAYHEEFWQSKVIADSGNGKDASMLETLGYTDIYPSEKELLEECKDASQTIWVWIASLLTRMSQDGQIPPIPAPSYGRIQGLAESAYNGIREVKAAVGVQTPWIYANMLALLVLANNCINALSFGLTGGVAARALLESHNIWPKPARLGHSEAAELRSWEDMVVCLGLSVIGPFLYQAVLEVAVCISQPFASSSGAGRIPTEKLLAGLARELTEAEKLAANLPWTSANPRMDKTRSPKSPFKTKSPRSIL
eukprot:TRINITY_DN93640_c0_g1_i1.p1 TRINITY_DN93640_c0_g1~~TRINITY_DN93640_c0_g1_i1.p1  ORF type:complete len:434 (+),score=76.49 TRINITY_DN93640_c0_g1_i1:111-1412(+)